MDIGVRRVGTVWCDVERLGLACVELWRRRGFAAAVLGDGAWWRRFATPVDCVGSVHPRFQQICI